MQLPPKNARLLSYLATLLPPAFFGIAFPDAFFAALDVAGTYGVLLLFGVIPAGINFLPCFGRLHRPVRACVCVWVKGEGGGGGGMSEGVCPSLLLDKTIHYTNVPSLFVRWNALTRDKPVRSTSCTSEASDRC